MTCDYGRPNCFPRSEEKASKENVSFTPLQAVCLKVALEPCGKGQLAQAAPKQSAKKKRGQKPKAGAKKSGKEQAQSAQSPQVVSVDARLTCLHPMSEWMSEWMGGLFYFWLGFRIESMAQWQAVPVPFVEAQLPLHFRPFRAF